jgi:hypothetical protein
VSMQRHICFLFLLILLYLHWNRPAAIMKCSIIPLTQSPNHRDVFDGAREWDAYS